MATQTRLDLFLLAGEPSGDRIGADLVRRLRARVDLRLSGVGGDELQALGLRPLYPMSDIAVMGYTDVLLRLPLLFWRIDQTVRAVLRHQPDIVVLIDSQEFSVRVAQRLRRKGFARPILLYVSPSVWGHKPHRAQAIRLLYNEVLAVLPFEPQVMRELGGPPTHYVGHPALSESSTRPVGLESGLVALLPGSRAGELRRHLPMFRAAVEAVYGDPGVTGFFLPTLPSLEGRLRQELATWPVPVELVTDRPERLRRYGNTLGALTSAGTATLELALAGVPMAAVYVMDAYMARQYDRLPEPPIVALPSIILGRRVLPELILKQSEPRQVSAALRALVTDREARAAQTAAFVELRALMSAGTSDDPREDPADRVLAYLDAAVPVSAARA